ncbi:MAG: cytochrome oxidase subunit III [Ignavibacteriae bacterium]|nr:MAG: cytochrome oxidase subunit III [Ignavibacteriota bacterium]
MKVNKKIYVLGVTLMFFLFSSSLFAGTATTSESGVESIIKIMVALTAFLVAIILWLVLVYSEKTEVAEEPGIKKLIRILNQRPTIDEEQKLLLDHDFDGIKELNNKIPPWFMAIFYICIVWAGYYMVNYHIIGSGNVQEEEYQQEVEIAAMEREILNKSGSLVNEDNVTILNDVAALSSGKDIFTKNCAACHGQNGEGMVGPNFTDDYWIHGNKINDLFKIIKYGVPAKGMISWESQLSPTQMQQVASYILTLRGTNPDNQKDPEGDLYEYNKEM